jgi:gliding motility-associated-like protein
VPNVFTPDNNTINDVFHPIYECDFLRYEFLIFNRWGMLLFESLDPTMSWNGMYRGSVVPTGVYVYSLKYSSNINNVKQIYGHVTVLK